MCKLEEEVSEHLVTERLESNEEMLEVAEDKYQQVISPLKADVSGAEAASFGGYGAADELRGLEQVPEGAPHEHHGGDHGPEEGGRAPGERSRDIGPGWEGDAGEASGGEIHCGAASNSGGCRASSG